MIITIILVIINILIVIVNVFVMLVMIALVQLVILTVVVYLGGAKGVPRSGGRERQLVRSCSALTSSHVRALKFTDVQTPFLGAPFVILKINGFAEC